MKKYFLVIILLTSCQFSFAQSESPLATFNRLKNQVKMQGEELLKNGFRAGDGYGEVWIRDFNTFMELSCKVNDKEVIKKHLITFFQFQQPDGDIVDGYVPRPKEGTSNYYKYQTPLAPEYVGHKNTVETDQESSLIQAVSKYIKNTGDASILKEQVDGVTVLKRIESAMQFLLTKRYSGQYGLLWGATTADWGDVQPEHSWGVEINGNTHKTIDIYDNAMFVIAINNFLDFPDLKKQDVKHWSGIRDRIKLKVREHLWDKTKQKFVPHIYLDGSPFPTSFDESVIYYHGGTATAIEAGLLSKAEVLSAYLRMQDNVKKAHASSIGLTIYPTYPAGFFKNVGMGPYSYQNGGDWTWFGARMVTQLVAYGFTNEALVAVQPMLQRVVKNKGFFEWYTPDNQPKGSSSFRGSAGVLFTAITKLEDKLKK
ncbi:glycogen debranching enzyme [Pedobacter sp. UYEF25]